MNEDFSGGRHRNLARLPEQIDEYSRLDHIWTPSREFIQLIGSVPSYIGVLREDEDTVRMNYFESQGFLPEIPLMAFFRGQIYARLDGKNNCLWLPESASEKRLRKIWGESVRRMLSGLGTSPSKKFCTYSGTMEDWVQAQSELDSSGS